MSVTFAILVSAYEVFLTIVLVILWEIVLLTLKYFPVILFIGSWNPLPPSVWYATFMIVLLLSFVADVGQIYYTAEDDDIRTLPIYGIRVATNYIMYGFLVSFMSLRYGFRNNFFNEAQLKNLVEGSGLMQRVVDAVVLDLLNVSVGRFVITFLEMLASVAGRAAALFTQR